MTASLSDIKEMQQQFFPELNSFFHIKTRTKNGTEGFSQGLSQLALVHFIFIMPLVPKVSIELQLPDLTRSKKKSDERASRLKRLYVGSFYSCLLLFHDKSDLSQTLYFRDNMFAFSPI